MHSTHTSELIATVCFTAAIVHTFLVKWFQHLALKFKPGSVCENLFHLLGEVEVVFGAWAAIYLGAIVSTVGTQPAIDYLQSRNFTEPAFVFVILVVCSTKPLLDLANAFIEMSSRVIPLSRPMAFYCATLILGPLLGSFITEPAAMTVTALILFDRFYKRGMSTRLMYATIGLLFVNVSIGGTLTPYAAPPVLMVAGTWNWDLSFMLENFGWKAAVSIVLATSGVAFRFRKEISKFKWQTGRQTLTTPVWVRMAHLVFLAGIVLSAHYMAVFIGIFLFFLGLVSVTKEYQSDLKLKEGLLVAFFLGGLVVLGGPQRWWLEPILTQLSAFPLYLGAIGLTAITDNAALTYLGAQVPHLPDFSKYALVAGSVVGGGLTVIANAPNPAGYGILNPAFGEEGISPLQLFVHALVPTAIAGLCFWLL